MEIVTTEKMGRGTLESAGFHTPNRTGKKSFSNMLNDSLEIQSKNTPPPDQEVLRIKADSENSESFEYTVKPGDSLWKIGRQLFKIDPYQIARDNRLSNPNLIRPGQKLIIKPAVPQPTPVQFHGEVTASWYGPEHHNKLTASGERFDMNKNTLAHKTLPIGTRVRLVNRDNGHTAEGIVNDRGPFIKGRDVDVSYAMAKQLGFVKKGVTKLDIETI